jgi:IS605 OrfB family transposase
VNQRYGAVRLSKFGLVRFRWTQSLNGPIRNATILRDGAHWYISFCVDDGRREAPPNGLPPIGVDRGVVLAVATSEGQCFTFEGFSTGRRRRLIRLQQRMSRQQCGSVRRNTTVTSIRRLFQCVRHRRSDFIHQTAHQLTTRHGVIAIEKLRVKAMTHSARGTLDEPGRNVRQKAGLNKAILDKAWSALQVALEWHGRKNGCGVISVPAAYTSQTCSACKHVAAESRGSQARFRCVACGHMDNADINAARNILAAGLAATGRGDLGSARSKKRQPPSPESAYAVT